jgi:hypothetical protein
LTSLGSVQNDDVPGERYTTDNGSVTHYYRIRHKGAMNRGAPHRLHAADGDSEHCPEAGPACEQRQR